MKYDDLELPVTNVNIKMSVEKYDSLAISKLATDQIVLESVKHPSKRNPIVGPGASTQSPFGLNPDLWLRSTDDAGMTIDTGVSVWQDFRRNGRMALQGLAAKQPIKVANALNGSQILRFDGINDFMFVNWDLDLSQGSTVFIVCNVKFANDLLYRPLLRVEPSNAFGVQHEASNDPSSPSKLEAFATATSGLKRATPAAATTQVPRCITVVVDPGLGTIRIWNSSILLATTAGIAGLFTGVGDVLRICADATTVNFGAYDLGEIAVFNRPFSDTERQTGIDFLTTTWGIA